MSTPPSRSTAFVSVSVPASAHPAWPSAVLASIAPVVGSVVTLVLRSRDAEQVAQLVVCVLTLIATGLPLLQRSTRADCRRAAPPGDVPLPDLGPPPRIVPSRTTVVLSGALGVAAFWLLYLLTTWVGLGSLGYWSGEYPSDPSAVYRAVALRSLVFLLGGIFCLAVAIAHRLHERAQPVLTVTVVLYTAAVLLTNLVLVHHRGSEPLPENIHVPLLLGALAWPVCVAACRRAARTQEFFDLVQALKARLRDSAGTPHDAATAPAGAE